MLISHIIFQRIGTMISLCDIHKSYGNLEVLKGIALSVDRGEVISVVGPSGAGKTTLLQIMGTLDAPTSGRVVYDGVDVSKMTDNDMSHFRNRNIGFVFQFHRLLPEFTLLENVAMPALIGGMARDKAIDRAMELIGYMGLQSRAQHRPSQLSGGECQRGAVARALVNSPAVVLADEPSGSLDSANKAELHQLFFNLRRDMGATFVIVTHDESLAASCDRVVHVRDGLIHEIQ